MREKGSRLNRIRLRAAVGVLFSAIALGAATGPGPARAADAHGSPAPDDEWACAAGTVLAQGEPDPALLSREASRGVRAAWCERYDATGHAVRIGPYREFYPNGRVRVQGSYIRSRLEGPVVIHHEDGRIFLRGFLEHGEWSGPLVVYHENGSAWLEANYRDGQLDGALRTHHADGALASETHFEAGREEGLARSFYASRVGGHLKSEVRFVADRRTGPQRLFDLEGVLERQIDWRAGSAGPAAIRVPATPPAAATPGPRDPDRWDRN